MISSDGASRRSLVLGLKVSPSTAMHLPATEPPIAALIFSTMRDRCLALARAVASAISMRQPAWRPVWIIAAMSLGKHDPAYPGPAWRNWDPMGWSRPMALATTCTSAPPRAQGFGTSVRQDPLVAETA